MQGAAHESTTPVKTKHRRHRSCTTILALWSDSEHSLQQACSVESESQPWLHHRHLRAGRICGRARASWTPSLESVSLFWHGCLVIVGFHTSSGSDLITAARAVEVALGSSNRRSRRQYIKRRRLLTITFLPPEPCCGPCKHFVFPSSSSIRARWSRSQARLLSSCIHGIPPQTKRKAR